MTMNAKSDKEKQEKESVLKLLNIIKKNNIDSNIQTKLNNIEKRINKD